MTPVLQYEDIDEVLHIEDTRPVAPARFTTADGLARDVMLLLEEEGSTRTLIAKRLGSEKGAGTAAVDEIIDSLIRRQLMVEIDGKVINLALAAPLPAVPAAWARQTELPEKVPETPAAPATAGAQTTAAEPA